MLQRWFCVLIQCRFFLDSKQRVLLEYVQQTEKFAKKTKIERVEDMCATEVITNTTLGNRSTKSGLTRDQGQVKHDRTRV